MSPLRTVIPLLLLVSLSTPCLADDSSRLAALLRQTGETSDVLGFLRGLRELGDIDLDRREIRRAMSMLGAPVTGAMGSLMNPTTALRIKGDRVELLRSEDSLIALGEAALLLGRRVRFKLSSNGGETTMTSIRGIDVGESRDSLYDLKTVVFREENGHPMAIVTAGVAIFTKTVKIRLPDPTPEVVAEAPVSSPPRRGLSDALGAATAEPQLGDRGPEVVDLQRKINAYRRDQGLELIDEDGILGRGTMAAWREYRAASNG